MGVNVPWAKKGAPWAKKGARGEGAARDPGGGEEARIRFGRLCWTKEK